MPIDHEIFGRLNDAQWLWYHYNFLQDEQESFESKRNLTEYLASFIEPEAVRQIVSARERSVEVSDDNLKSAIRTIGGRDFNVEKANKSDGKIHSADPKTAMQHYKATQGAQDTEQPTYKDWMSLDLE